MSGGVVMASREDEERVWSFHSEKLKTKNRRFYL
jgi:hypothetical protein